MTRKQKWIVVFTALLSFLVPAVVLFATVTQGAGMRHEIDAFDCYTLSVHFSSTDTSKVITLPTTFGTPDFIVCQQAFDNATSGRAKAAMQSGETINFAPNEYGGASLNANQLTIYRTDLDGNDTLTSDVWFEVTFADFDFYL